jgi:hypothetical protein
VKVFVCDDMTELSNITNIGTIIRMIDAIPSVTISLNDLDGALYDSYADVAETTKYSNLQFQPIWIMNDDEDVYLFIGRIKKVEFNDTNCILSCEGTSAKLKDKPYTKNYILASGKVKTVEYDGNADQLELETDEDVPEAFSWEVTYWATEKNTGLLLTDNTSDLTSNKNIGSLIANTLYHVTSTFVNTVNSTTENDLYGTLTVTTTEQSLHSYSQMSYYLTNGNIATTNDISKIILTVDSEYTADYDGHYLHVYLWNGTSWVLKYIGSTVRQSLEIEITGTPAELASYFDVLGDNYTTLRIMIQSGFQSPWYVIPSGKILTGKIYYINAEVQYSTATFSPVQYQITNNGASWLESNGVNFANNGVVAGDKFSIGENTTKILNEAIVQLGLNLDIDATFDKYIARDYKNHLPYNFLNEITQLEDAHWTETYDADGNVTLVIYKEENFTSSGYTLTEANYRKNFKIEREANSYNRVKVYGNPYFSVEATAVDSESISPQEFVIIEQSINTQTDAQALANSTLNRLKNIRPSYVLELIGSYEDIQPGTLITATLTKPSIVLTEQPIRRVDITQGRYEDDIKVKIYVGMGQSPPDETLGRTIKKGLELAWKNTNQLLSSPLITGLPVISHTSLTNLSNDDHTQYYNETRGDARYSLTSHTHDTTYLKLSGGTMTGNIAMGSKKLTGLDAGSDNGDSVRYEQVARLTDNQTIAGIKTFSSFPITPSEAPASDYQVANKKYVDDQIDLAVGGSIYIPLYPTTNIYQSCQSSSSAEDEYDCFNLDGSNRWTRISGTMTQGSSGIMQEIPEGAKGVKIMIYSLFSTVHSGNRVFAYGKGCYNINAVLIGKLANYYETMQADLFWTAGNEGRINIWHYIGGNAPTITTYWHCLGYWI